MHDHKEDCIRYLAHRLRGSSDWRRCQSVKFPTDPRNPRARQRLLELSTQIAIPDHVWVQIAPYYNESDSHWLAAVSDTNRDVGFRRNPRDFDEYLQNLLANLTRRY